MPAAHDPWQDQGRAMKSTNPGISSRPWSCQSAYFEIPKPPAKGVMCKSFSLTEKPFPPSFMEGEGSAGGLLRGISFDERRGHNTRCADRGRFPEEKAYSFALGVSGRCV